MSLYTCKNCGSEESFFPAVMLAVNTQDPLYPYHNNEFEQRFEEFRVVFQVEESFKKLYQWLGINKLLWFCSIECSIEFLEKKGSK